MASMFRRFVAPMILGVAVASLAAKAEPAAAPKPVAPSSTDVATKQLIERQQRLLRDYKAITEDLLALAHRYEKSSKIEDQDKAKLIMRAIDLGDKEGVDNKFQTLLRTLAGKSGTITYNDVTTAKGQSEELVTVLKAILAVLMSDDEMARIRAEKNLLEKMLADLKGIIRETKVQRAITENGKGDPKKLAKDQGNLAKKTDDLAKRMDPSAKDSKGGDPKDGKSGMGKDGKGGDPKDGKGGEGKDGKGGMGKDGKGGMGKDGKGGMGKDGMGGMGQESPPSPPGPQGQKAPGADQVKKAVPDQKDAAKRLEEDKRPDAAQKQTDAAQKLEEAQRELEKRLKQLREEELERLLANLEARVAKMLQMQIEVYEATKSINVIVVKSGEKVAAKPEIQKSQVQSDKEGEIMSEAEKAIEILKQEGSAVAFPRIFEETVIDMKRVKERLNKCAAEEGDQFFNKNTQFLEEQIIASLKEMLEALKKAQQELRQQPPSPPGAGGQPPDQKLLDEIAELKMLRNLQVRVNERTKRNGAQIKDKAEQVDEGQIQIKVELKDLANRQVKIEEMARDIATGKNK
jgi:hypothetical protein